MSQVVNPSYQPFLELVADQATWDVLKAKIQAHFDNNKSSNAILVTTLRALDPAFADDALWRQIESDMNLLDLP